jgi:uncharacterized protein YggE
MTFDQIRGPIERLLYIGLGWLVARGHITSEDVANYATLALAIAAAVYGWWQNRPKAIAQSAAALPGTTVVTTPALAQSTPDKNIISSSVSKEAMAAVVAQKAAEHP